MFGAYVRFKWNYVALRKFSDNQQQHLFLGQRWILGNMMWMWQKEDTGLWEIGLSGFWKFNSLRNTLTNSRLNVSLSLCLLFTLMKQHLDMCTYKVVTKQRRQWLATFDIAIHNRFKDRRYLLGYLLMFQFHTESHSIFYLGTIFLYLRLQISLHKKKKKLANVMDLFFF